MCECGNPLSDSHEAFMRGLCADCYLKRVSKVRPRLSELSRVVWFFGRPYLWRDGGAGLCLVRMPGWWKP